MNIVDFREMPYSHPDFDHLGRFYETVIEKLKNAASYDEARAAFFELQEEQKNTDTMISLCSVRNTIDTADEYYAGEIKKLREQSAAMIPLRKNIIRRLQVPPSAGNLKRNSEPSCFVWWMLP